MPADDDVERRRSRAWLVAAIVCGIALVIFYVWVMQYRFANAETPYALHGDQQQSIGHYWRYKVEGSFPKGHLISDYAETYHSPPLWWPVMAPLSAILGPLTAAKLLGLVAYALFAVTTALVVSARTTWALGFLTAIVALRNPPDAVEQITGGMARSMSPALLLLFMFALMQRRHRLALGVLVLQAGIYPSIVIPCGLTYGAYCVLSGPTMRDRLRRCAGMFVTGLVIIVFGLYQNLAAPEWWGKPVTYEEAAKMTAWHVGGRFPEVPHRDLWPVVEYNLTRTYKALGAAPMPDAAVKYVGRHMNEVFIGLPLTVTLLGGLGGGARLLWRRRRRRALSAVPAPPALPSSAEDASSPPAPIDAAPGDADAQREPAAEPAAEPTAEPASVQTAPASLAAVPSTSSLEASTPEAPSTSSAVAPSLLDVTPSPATLVVAPLSVTVEQNAAHDPASPSTPAVPVEPPEPPNPFPWEAVWILAGGLASYAIVRGFAFKFFLPSRQVGFIVPFVVTVTLPLLVWWGVRATLPRTRLVPFLIAVVVTCVPAFAFRGHGGGRTAGGYSNKNPDGPLFEAVRKLPFDEEIACDVHLCNYMMPLGQHIPYAAETLTHPLRAGYYKEAERRLIENMRLLHATSVDEVEGFVTKEKVKYFAYRTTEVGQVSTRLFKPVTTSVTGIFRQGRDRVRVFAEPPKDAIIFRKGKYVLIDLEKMVTALKAPAARVAPSVPDDEAPEPTNDDVPRGPED